ncbi:uncharacterized protein LOC127279692 [Leptopilina boulardi]|uniref:uncharacterized protein LOC127279692 n=1 Tax=Leptopilina boulardi TaxID=63433 RepID=UPI0021F66BDE|nr:uncharacterized protein LOC127279692 [Leptopilina boulardi]
MAEKNTSPFFEFQNNPLVGYSSDDELSINNERYKEELEHTDPVQPDEENLDEVIEKLERDRDSGKEHKEENKEKNTGTKTKEMPERNLPKITNNQLIQTTNLSVIQHEYTKLRKLQEESVIRMRSSLNTLEKVLVESNQMLAHMVQLSNNNLEVERLRLRSLELEAERKSEKKEEPRAQRSRVIQNLETRCHRCNGTGHWAKDCHLKNCDQWFCYYCQKIANHKGDDCPTVRKQSNDRYRDKRGN